MTYYVCLVYKANINKLACLIHIQHSIIIITQLLSYESREKGLFLSIYESYARDYWSSHIKKKCTRHICMESFSHTTMRI